MDIQFRDISFHYGGQDIDLCIPELKITQGERVAIAGPNGAGKSTLAKVLARLYDVQAGEIRIAGADIRDVKLESLRQAVCYLDAHPAILHRTVAENLRLGNPESGEEELRKALRQVGLFRFLAEPTCISEQPLAPGGADLSSGERQRLAIARALLQKPRILILDEATSCIDAASELALLREIDRWLPESTLLVVSHRLPSLRACERVIVLEGGKMVWDGAPNILNWMAEAPAHSVESGESSWRWRG